jgi:hypothetical protein
MLYETCGVDTIWQFGELQSRGGRLGRDLIVAGFTTTFMQSASITTNIVNSNPAHGEVYLIQHSVSGFLRVLQFLPPIKLTATI